MSSSQANLCLNVNVKETEYKSIIANGFVVLAFFLCLIVTAIIVILLVLYVIKQLREDKEREKQSERRKTLRQLAAKKLNGNCNDDESNSAENMPLDTNYLWSINEIKDNEKVVERSHSRISFFIDESKQISTAASDTHLLEVFGALFTSSRNTSPPTYLHNCLWLRESCFDLVKSFHHEAFSSLLNLMLSALFEEKKINEIEKLQLTTKYEQMIDENFTLQETADFTNKLHFVLCCIENQIQEMTQNDVESSQCLFTGERFSKYLTVIQREMLSHQYDDIVKEMLVNTEKWLVNIITERWCNLEVARYRINIVYESIEELLQKKGEKRDMIQDILNGYIVNIYENLNEFCSTYEKEIFDLISQINKDKQSNKRQALIELETKRFEQRSDAMQILDFAKKKAVSKFVIAQIDWILNDFKTIANYQIMINSEGLELFEDFQKINNKKLVKILKNCEEELFEKLEKEEIVDGENLIELGKTMSVNLKDFKIAQEKDKVDILEKNHASIGRIGNLIDSIYLVLEKKFTKGVEDLKQEHLEILHSLSNIEETEMNKLEHDFEVAFSCLAFSLNFVVMTEVVHKIHAALWEIITKHSDKDISLSLHDMVQILKQDKSVIKRPSLFQMPNKELYPVIERELTKIEGSLTLAVDNYLEAVSIKIDNFFLPKVNGIIQDTILRQSQMCVSNLYLAKEKLLSCSTNSKGYTSKQASSLAKDCFMQIRNIWESQADFKAHKLREGKDEIMKDFEPVIETFFDGKNEGKKLMGTDTSVEKGLKLELKFFKNLEELVRGNSVERVLDCNLENGLMVVKLHDKIESFESRTTGLDDLNNSRRRNLRSQRSHENDGSSKKRKESLRHSISRKNKKH